MDKLYKILLTLLFITPLIVNAQSINIHDGASYSDFTWTTNIGHTRGLINTSQTITTPAVCNEDGGFDINAGNNTTGEGFTIHVSFTGDKYIGVVTYW
jgi:hypothetical protein